MRVFTYGVPKKIDLFNLKIYQKICYKMENVF